jgi:1-acyl-sn-glycerol-3-phosphate acyltransferase
MERIKFWLYQPYKYLIFFPLFVVVTIFCSVFAALFAMLFAPRIGSYFGVLWAKLCSWITPMFVTVKNRHNIDPKQSYVVVANHQSAYDIFVLYGYLGIDFKWVMKKELRKAPGIGWASEKVGHIFIDRSSARSAMESIEAAKRNLINGTSVVIFPEGTRSRTGELGKFKKGAFKIAFELELPILPVTIRDTYKILGSGFFNLMPGNTELIIHEPVKSCDYKDDHDKLVEKVHQIIGSAL